MKKKINVHLSAIKIIPPTKESHPEGDAKKGVRVPPPPPKKPKPSPPKAK